MSYLEICHYPEGDSGPVKEWLDEMAGQRPEAFMKLRVDLEVLGAEGLRSPRVVVRPMGDGLWELKRSYEGIQYRIFFCVEDGSAWLLHSIEKKSAKTPLDDLRLARKRMRRI